MTAWWFIDAIDPRGGLAVATWRESDLLDEKGALPEGPSIFVGPPTFVPELVASRATGFALARVSGQIGLFDDKGEIPFKGPAEVVEFVRRTYLRGAGGDGAGESGGTPPL
jgi:hypothetical protein